MFPSTSSFNDLYQFDQQDQHDYYSSLFQFPNSPFFLDNDDNNFIFNEEHQNQPPLPTPLPPPPLPLPPTRIKTMKQKSGSGGDVRRRVKKDRHSKIYTAQGPRDRRMRLSLQIARKFFDLQDMLGFDKASKTIEWLFSNSKAAIKEVANGGTLSRFIDKSHSDCSSDSEVVSSDSKSAESNREISRGVTKHSRAKRVVKEQKKHVSNDVNIKESREKARARARERTKQKMKNKSDSSSIELSKLGLRIDHGSHERNLITCSREVPDREENQVLGFESVLDFNDQANAFIGFTSNFNQVQSPSAIFMEEDPNSNLYADQEQNFNSIYTPGHEENPNSLSMNFSNSNFEQVPGSALMQDSQFLENYLVSNSRSVDGNKYNVRLY